jgi:hypothetical protein
MGPFALLLQREAAPGRLGSIERHEWLEAHSVCRVLTVRLGLYAAVKKAKRRRMRGSNALLVPPWLRLAEELMRVTST